MPAFGSPEEVVATVDGLAARGLAEHVGRRPGQKEDRWRQLLGAEAEEEPAAEPAPQAAAAEWTPAPAAPAPPPPPPVPVPVPDERVERLEREVAALRAELDELKTQLGVS